MNFLILKYYLVFIILVFLIDNKLAVYILM